MSCSILSDGTNSCFYDDTTMVAFGPIMESEEQADAFHNWIIAEQDGRYMNPKMVPISHLINTLWPDFFEHIWPDRNCKGCDMYDEETIGGICHTCREEAE